MANERDLWHTGQDVRNRTQRFTKSVVPRHCNKIQLEIETKFVCFHRRSIHGVGGNETRSGTPAPRRPSS